MIETELKKLEEEIAAQKAVYEKMATQMPVFTKSINFTTSGNRIKIVYPGGTEHETDGNERVVVTFATNRGSNTLAVLEMTTDGLHSDLKVRRVPYTGGARWVVYSMPNYDGNANRIDTHYTFTVQSAVDGTLGAKMIWQ